MIMENENQSVELEIVPPSALEAQERAQCDVQIATAHRFPRPDLSVIVKKMKSFATLDEETAEGCFYVLNRQGKEIRGPSARLAEIACACYGNIRAASRIIANDGKTITSQAVCHDLENNVSISIETKRKITGKDGKTYSEDMQVTTGNAACSIALRNAVFKVIPLALIRPVYDAARACAIGDVKTLASRREKAVETFGKMGIVKERVLAVVNKPSVDDIDLPALETLLGIHTAIKDGDTSIDEAFPALVTKKPIFEKKEPSSPKAASGGESPEVPVTQSGAKDPEGTAQSVSTQATTMASLESQLTLAMARDNITAEELGRTLKSFGKGVPRKFTGPGDLTDAVLADALASFDEYRGVILAERGNAAS